MRESIQPGETKVISYNQQRHAIHPHPYSRKAGSTKTTTAHYPRYRTKATMTTSSSPSSCNKKCNDTVSLPSIQLKSPQRSSSACGIPLHTSKAYLSTRTSRNMGNGGGSSSSSSGSKPPSFQAQWMFFSNSQWIPLDTQSHLKLERTLQLDGVFVDIQDSHFPGVERIRVFPGADYLSYLGIRYRICRVLLPSL